MEERNKSKRGRMASKCSPFHLRSRLPGDFHRRGRSPYQSQDLTEEGMERKVKIRSEPQLNFTSDKSICISGDTFHGKKYQNGRKSGWLSTGHLSLVWLRTGPAYLQLQTNIQNMSLIIRYAVISAFKTYTGAFKFDTEDFCSCYWHFYSITSMLSVEGHQLGAGFDVVPLAGEGTASDIVDPLLRVKTRRRTSKGSNGMKQGGNTEHKWLGQTPRREKKCLIWVWVFHQKTEQWNVTND